MKQKKQKVEDLIKVENFIDYNKTLKVEDKTFEKLMFIYTIAIRELQTKIGILKDEFNVLYDYNLIDHIDTRIKAPESIIQKMKKREIPLTYKNMIENINDIAGVRIVCPFKKDISIVQDLIRTLPNINILKEKDYITHPKKSGYSSYHFIVEVPISLSKQNIYVKSEIQIRTVAMDFWANCEHKMKYKSKEKIDKKESNLWINSAKLINKLDNQMTLLN